MTQDMRTGRYTRFIVTLLLLLTCGAGKVWADDITVIIDEGITHGTVTSSVNQETREVTLTVTPAPDYKTRKDLILVEKMVKPDRMSAPRRAPALGTFVLTGTDEWVTDATTFTFIIPTEYDGAYITAIFVKNTANLITSLSDIPNTTEGLNGTYELAADIDASGFEGLGEFKGTLDGKHFTIHHLDHPLFASTNGATIRNINFENVNITSGDANGDAGAVTSCAKGATRIYNCGILPTTTVYDADGNITGFLGSSVGGSRNVGGLVGKLEGNARVINCFSYANITSGTTVAGIVGNNTTTAITQINVETVGMVVNCMFYGDITGGTYKYPVYGGSMIKNDANNGVNPYCYFRKNATFDNYYTSIEYYNRSWPAEDKNLTRFEYYRSILNSNRRLCTWWVNGTNETAPTDDDIKTVGIAKWVLDETIAPFPILKKWDKYPSVINIDPDYRINPDTKIKESRSLANEWEGKSYGKLEVVVKPGSHNSSADDVTKNITITDMDTLNHDYGYYKIQLPYYNDVFGNPNGTSHAAKYGNNYTDYVVTGWKITAVNDNDQGAGYTFNTNAETGYNFTDRNDKYKDLYAKSGRVFAQGGYYYVPEGVTSINIEAYWGKAVYLTNRGYTVDRVKVTAGDYRKADKSEAKNFNPAGTVSNTFQTDYTVYDDLQTAISALGSSNNYPTVYDQAIVLIGNHQVKNGNESVAGSANNWHPFTIMSADFDFDNEPDYCLELQFRSDVSRPAIQPIRFDFLPVIELGLAVRHNKLAYAIGLMVPQGHFEITETALMRTTQFEWDANVTKFQDPAPIILNGGEFEQLAVRYAAGTRTSYFLLGGHLWFHRFAPGAHPHPNNTTNIGNPRLCPVSVIGGDFPEFYLSGLYKPERTPAADQGNPYCYINGGHFGTIHGAGYDKIDGNVTFKINHAAIGEFYGGGINGSNPIGGNIDVTIDNSRVNKYCGGPKVGDMTGKTVTTHATGTTFGVYYGGGNGGNSYYRQLQLDGDQRSSHIGDWSGDYNWGNFNPLVIYDDDTNAENKGYHAEYEFEVFNQSNGVADDITQRGFIKWIQFGITITGNVTNILTDCTVENSFYGGGNLATVNGTVTSTLTNTTVNGSVFGAGYSASIPTFQVQNKAGVSFPSMDFAGTITDGHIPYTNTVYEWTNDNNNEQASETNPTYSKEVNGVTKWYCYTWNPLTNLGAVTGNATLNIEGTTTVVGSVYGGGEESNVSGNTQVNVTGGTISQNVFGGGKGEADEFSCSKAMVGVNDEGKCADPGSETNKNKGTIVTISNGTVNGNVYGGGEVGRVEWNTQVKIGIGTGDGPFAPVINGNVFGAGRGKETHGYAALVRGNSSVTVQGNAKVGANVYGGGEQATVGRYWVKGISTTLCPDDANETVVPPAPDGLPNEMPYKTRRGGKSTVIVQGNAQIGPNEGGTETVGHVFGAGKGVTPNYVHTGDKENWSKRMVDYNATKHTGEPGTTWDYYPDDHNYVWEYFTTEDKYFEFLQTLALVTGTDVTISGSATVKGSVYGGSESGYVQDDTDVKVTGGTIGTSGSGGAYFGNVYGGGKGDVEHMGTAKKYVAAGLVKGNTNVSISGTDTRIWHNVYGGGAYGSVGEFTYDATTGLPTALATANTGTCTVTITGGTLGSNGDENGLVFGSSRGDVGAPVGDPAVDPNDRLAWVYSTHVTIGNTSVETSPTIKGSVYGSGENGHTFQNTIVDIQKGTIGITTGEEIGDYSGALYPYRGNVYGGGCGTDMYDSDDDGNDDAYNPLAGIVRGNATVNISGGHVVHNVYGAGAMGSVGNDAEATSGKTTINISGGRIGYTGERDGNVFGAARGGYGFSTAESNLANVRESEVNITYTTTPAADNEGKTEQLIAGSVFGGGEAGMVKESVAVNMTGGLLLKDLYGGGALAHTQTSNWDTSANNNAGGWANSTSKSALYTTTVRLTGGTILGEAYGGGLGQKTGVNGAESDIEAYVYGDVLLDLNGTTTMDNTTGKPTTTGTLSTSPTRGCAVNEIFGCNNINGTPKGDVMVHVDGTQNKLKTTIADKFIREKDSDTEQGSSESAGNYVTRLQGILTGKIALAEALDITVSQEYKDLCSAENPTATDLKTAITGITTSIDAKTTEEINAVRYDMVAVYGGGDMAAYVPVSPYTTSNTSGAKTQVIIEGCNETSIETVYGGGNAAAVPETNVDIKGAYEIGYLFGGGNGKDKILINDVLTENPGADIGQYNNGTATVTYGTGNANSLMEGGLIHEAYGGSNTKGVLKGSINQVSAPKSPGDTDYCCDLILEKIVGAGKYADIDGDVNMTLSCQPSSKVPLLFAGADEANVNGNITLNITNGLFGKVFGGNNLGGAVKGKITVNVEETGCQPIKIDNLYLGGNEAAYSVFGYYESDEIQTETGKKILKPRESAADAHTAVENPATDATHTFPYAQPELNIISCTYIGNVYGGGLGETAKMYANPTVNINMVKGAYGDNETVGVPKVMTTLNLPSTENTGHLGIIENVFGGGDAADIYGTTTVNIATEANKGAYITGMVFGGGNNADVKGNTSVNMAGGYVKDRVYGGGKLGNVGTFTRKDKADSGHNHVGNCMGKPDTWTANTGRCVVTVSGGQVGPLGMTMPDDYGYVFGAGRGETADPNVDVDVDFKTYVHDTRVIIKNTYAEGYATANDSLSHITKAPLICGGVYGGSEAGRVGNNTDVRIYGGQIGLGNGQTAAYTEAQWTAAVTAVTSGNASNIATAAQAMPECNSWTYDPTHNALPYDVHANDASYNAETIGAASTIGYDGHTFYGNVFGGGSGYFAYTGENVHGWLRSSGLVEGDTHVTISGGHILTSVYGGNELTDVNGKCYVKMTGGTLGVPRTLAQIAAHPVTCYLFGAGKGDQRIHFNTFTNVGAVDVNISGGTIFGSVFGGGEDGHVLGNVDLAVSGGHIGTWGTSYFDGNVFGGGRGFSGTNLNAGSVAGTVTMNISGGTMLGSVYGGGRLGNVNDDITIAISGGTIGNGHEYTYDANHVLTHTKGGNVFAGGMGRMYQLDGTTPISEVDWWELGSAKSTKVTISDNAVIKSCVYGGGELGWVVGTHATKNAANEDINVGTEVIVNGGTIGTEIKDANQNVKYTFGSVFGGGYGSAIEMLTDANSKKTYPKFQAGRVKYSTKVDMTDGMVRASVYGGGELANVGYGFYSYNQDGIETVLSDVSEAANTYVTVSGGTIGKAKVGDTYFGGATMGNVYGGGSGSKTIVRCGLVIGNTHVNISGENTRIYHNVYGGGAYGSVGDFEYETNINDPNYQGIIKVFGIDKLHTSGTGTANVTVTGGTIGYDGKDNGMVFGSSRGDVQGEGTRDDYMAWVNDAKVTIGTSGASTGPHVRGSVYGSGENGHVLNNTNVKIYSGKIGIDNADTSVEGYTVTSGGKPYNGPEYSSRGNVYGGGCGTDTYTKDNKEYYNPTAGIVKGNTTVTMTGGHVVRSVYGGGSMGSVGTFTEDGDSNNNIPDGKPTECATGTGLCTITISGGKIGPTTMAMPNYYGNVFGAGRGEMHDPADYPNLETSAYFNETDVTITGTAFVKGSVYGGAESGHVLNDTKVEINGNCQIGCGYDGSTNGAGDLDRVYTAAEWAYDVTTDNTKFLYECNSWPYQAPYTPYDKFADENGKYPDNSSADNAHSTGTDGHTFYGNVFGGGSGSTPYAPGKWLPTAGWVEGNTTVEIKGGHILTSVYGGNEMSDVGAGGVRKMTDLTNETADMFYDITKPGGKCTVKMSGGTLGVPRTLAQIAAHPLTCYLFGASKGDQRIFFNKTTNVKEVEVEVSGGRIYGSVFGGGEDGHVMKNVTMTIKDNAYIGTWGTSYVEGNVFGGGRGFSGEALTAGNVGGCVEINIQGGTMLGSVYGGGRLGSVGYGLYLVDETVGNEQSYGVMRPNNVDDRGNAVSNFNRGYITINISGGTIGNNIEYQANPSATDKQKMPTTTFDSQNHLLYTRGGNVFAGCMGRLYSLENELLPLWPKLGRCRQTTLNITGGTIKSNVYGGAELGVVEQNTSVNITGGQVGTQIGTGSGAYYYGSVFGSGKGSNDNITYPSATPAAEQIPISEAGTTGGNVEVHLNKDVAANTPGGIVRKVFGCNDMNGTPKGDVLVHIHATQSEGTTDIATKASGYDVSYVFGGGNNADYVPTETGAKQHTEVIIEGCDLTSIEEVYGGGFGAATPGTKVEVRGTKIINNLFGGGYGAGENNPGANVGIRTDGTTEYGNTGAGVKTAVVRLMAGTVNNVYGGSNTKGDIRGGSSITNIDKTGSQGTNQPCCDVLNVDNIYGGGKDAEMAGGAEIVLGCMPNDWISEIYAGAENADVGNDVSLTLTSGKFGRVFGGNKSGGKLDGQIEVNIEESETCGTPIIIGELYGGGNLAPYSIYGYNDDGTPRTAALPNVTPHNSPRVNVRRFTSIGNIFGGGLGANAVMVGSPTVNINEVAFNTSAEGYQSNEYNPATDNTKPSWIGDGADQVKLWPHTNGQMGVIGNVFGGGNAAQVIGDTHVNIATESSVKFESIIDNTIEGDDKRVSKTVVGADIRGNVFGGGNNAAVTGNTNVNIGKKKEGN